MNATLMLSHVAINGRSAVHRKDTDPNGGALLLQEQSTAILTNVEIVGNSAADPDFETGNFGSGGGIYVKQRAVFVMIGSLVAGNRCEQHGGGVYIENAKGTGNAPTVHILDTTFCGNIDTTDRDDTNGIFWSGNYPGESNCLGNPPAGQRYRAHCWPAKHVACTVATLTCTTTNNQTVCTDSSDTSTAAPLPEDSHEWVLWVVVLSCILSLVAIFGKLRCCTKTADLGRVSTFEGFYARMGDADSIKGIDRTHISSLRDAVALVTDPSLAFITDPALAAHLSDGCDLAERFADRLLATGPDPYGLNRDEIAAIHLYTQEVMYRPLNRALWSQQRGQVRPYWGYIRLLQQALFKVPKSEAGSIFRGIKDPYEPITEADMLAVATERSKAHPNGGSGKPIIWWGFSSCSTNQQPVMNFLGKEGVRVLYTIEGGSSARNVRKYSAFEGEDEVLMPFGAVFKVITASTPAPDLLLVTLRQMNDFAWRGRDQDECLFSQVEPQAEPELILLDSSPDTTAFGGSE